MTKYFEALIHSSSFFCGLSSTTITLVIIHESMSCSAGFQTQPKPCKQQQDDGKLRPCLNTLAVMHGNSPAGGDGESRGQGLTEVRAGLVLVTPIEINTGHYSDGDTQPRRQRWARRGGRLRTWVLPLMRVIALAAAMLSLTPTRGMGTSLALMDVWAGGGEQQHYEDRYGGINSIVAAPTMVAHPPRPHGQRREHVVFVGVPEESAVLPLKALAQAMIARGYRASLALPPSFQSWVQDIPGLAFIALSSVNPNSSNHQSRNAPTTASGKNILSHPASHHSGITASEQPGTTPHSTPSNRRNICSARPPGRHGRKACSAEGLGDAWGGGVGGGWGTGLGLWRGLRGSLVGARELLEHFTAYLGFYHREEAVMYAPLVEALRRDPPALVVADRRALAAFRACSELGLRCVVNSAGFLGDLDRPPNSVPAPYTGFPVEGRTIGQRLHSSLVRLVLALSRLQAARDADNLAAWRDYNDPLLFGSGRGYISEEIMTLGNSCFGSLEHPRALPARVHMVGPLWMRYSDTKGRDDDEASPHAFQAKDASSHGKPGGSHDELHEEEKVTEGKGKGLDDVWAWLEPDGVEGGEEAPVVVVHLGRGAGEAWGVPADAAVAVTEGNPTWKAFRDETVNRLSAVGCRTLWIGTPDEDEEKNEEHPSENVSNPSRQFRSSSSPSHRRSGDDKSASVEDQLGNVKDASPKNVRPRNVEDYSSAYSDDEAALDNDHRDTDLPRRDTTEELEGRRYTSMVFEPDQVGGSSEFLLRVMSHRSVTVLATDGDLRSVQSALWHGKPLVVLPTALDEREAAARLGHVGAGVTCPPPCEPSELVTAVIDAHNLDKRWAALRAHAALRESGGVVRAANLLENELHTNLAATARRNGFRCDHPSDDASSTPSTSRSRENNDLPCWSKERRAARRRDRNADPAEEWEEPPEQESIRGPVPGIDDLDLDHPEDATWYPDEPEWILREMSWAQRHLVDVYAVYGALVMGVGLLMKLTWNLVWSLCDISTAPAHPRGNGNGKDNPQSPSQSPSQEGAANGTMAAAGGKVVRGGSGKGWGSGGISAGGGGLGAGKHSKGGAKGHHGNGTNAVYHAAGVSTPVGGGGSRGSSSKKMSALTNGHGHAR